MATSQQSKGCDKLLAVLSFERKTIFQRNLLVSGPNPQTMLVDQKFDWWTCLTTGDPQSATEDGF